MTAVLPPLEKPEYALFVVHALTDEEIATDLRAAYGNEAFEETVDNAKAVKGEAVTQSFNFPTTYEELKEAQEAYDAWREADIIARKEADETITIRDVQFLNAALEGKKTLDTNTLTPQEFIQAAAEKDTVVRESQASSMAKASEKDATPHPTKVLFEEGEVDADKQPRAFSEAGTEMVLAAAKVRALNPHPIRKGEDVVALHFLADNSPRIMPKNLSRLILGQREKGHTKRAALATMLLRLV